MILKVNSVQKGFVTDENCVSNSNPSNNHINAPAPTKHLMNKLPPFLSF